MIIYKVDIKYPDNHCTYVKYEVYNPMNLTLLDLSICKDLNIVINSPVDLDDKTSLLYDNLRKSGFDLFNESDAFYNDPCTTYTSINNTDITLDDRKQLFLNNSANVTLCQSGCQINYYNSKTKKAKCICIPEYEEIEDLFDSTKAKFNVKMISDNFMQTITNTNFIVLKCYKLAFDLTTIWTNIGRICIAIILLLFIFFVIFFYLHDHKTINKLLKYFLMIYFNYNIDSISSNMKNNNKKKDGKKIEIKKKPSTKKFSDKRSTQSLKIINKYNENDKNKNCKNDRAKKSKHVPPKKDKKIIDLINLTKFENNNSSSKVDLYEDIKKKIRKKKTNINIIKINNLKFENFYKKRKSSKESKTFFNFQKINSPKKVKNKILKSVNNSDKNDKNINLLNKKDKNKTVHKIIIDYELDNLKYKEALKIDNRTYCQYYWSLLKRKHILLFAFYPNKDYNLFSIKKIYFLISFALYITIAGFFFDNESMHNIYMDNGIYNFLSEIPKILISSLITSVTNVILNRLSLSVKNFILVKNQKTLKLMLDSSKRLKKELMTKFSLFFVLVFLCLLFCFYFISCFCGIYPNTQIILIKNSLFSFCLSMLYPFGFYLIPGLFRIPALRASKKDKKCLFNFGYFISLI